MAQVSLDDLEAVLAVAREGSFTRAAAKLGVSQSTLSQTVRGLEERLGVRLLTRTTRSVAPTEAGARLIANAGPRLEEVRRELSDVRELRDRPAGTVRISADEYAAEAILWPALERFLPAYPEINIEIIIDLGLTDIVAGRYDAGVRLGEIVDKDMIAVPISEDERMLVVGAPSYFEANPKPAAPSDLTRHRCINLRLPTRGGLYVWEFEKSGRELNVRVEGQLTFNSLHLMLQAALAGFGLAYLPARHVAPYVAAGGLSLCLRIGAHPIQAITSTIRADVTIRQPSHSSSRHCGGAQLRAEADLCWRPVATSPAPALCRIIV